MTAPAYLICSDTYQIAAADYSELRSGGRLVLYSATVAPVELSVRSVLPDRYRMRTNWVFGIDELGCGRGVRVEVQQAGS